ncbi:23S rRNA (pseudouridine(1915)-N(3))-methyltransferase RlmH [Suttonella sp. R2A3]|uniref:23S rRNA (pseudouridine(1915)-N(3))-methyltransferase RlmH n=1 Tax=Suttonella sp. R2A3 TaxID=2908648 RepID=UPI001F3A39AB|nr:23S rRNA (pseudouridine(1915)-N(3))-methyltransferase RlmH [Suttonella sp. R2A3]UJF23990.1 23S rRNA (pseudouridine(1915)-N(3))-methyltransferase RlmH [Suttonella sp. R2A3]
MHIHLIAVGHKMPAWVSTGFNEYQNRLKGDLTLSLSEIPLQKRSKASQLASARAKESDQVMSALASADYVVSLDIPGKVHSSESLASRLAFWQENVRELALVIGGPEGLSDEVKKRADESWSLGKLTLPHPLVRIIVAEALYRAWSINHNHPYHRA